MRSPTGTVHRAGSMCGREYLSSRQRPANSEQGVRLGPSAATGISYRCHFNRSKIISLWERVMKTGSNSTGTAASQRHAGTAVTVAAAVATILAAHSGVARAADEEQQTAPQAA